MHLPPVASLSSALDLYEPASDLLYSIEAAARMTHLPRRHIALYYRHGLVSPVMDPETGGWYFNDEAIRTLRHIERLRAVCGMNPDALRLILTLLREVELLRQEVACLRRR